MFERLKTPEDVFSHKLGSALTMERDIVDMLGDLQEKAQSDQLKQMLSHHQDETRQHVRNIEEAFRAFGHEPDDSLSLWTKAVDQQGKADIRMAQDGVVDEIILAGASETEHHEMAVYEALITHAQAMGNDRVVQLLSQNLEQEQHTLDEVRQALTQLAQREVAHA